MAEERKPVSGVETKVDGLSLFVLKRAEIRWGSPAEKFAKLILMQAIQDGASQVDIGYDKDRLEVGRVSYEIGGQRKIMQSPPDVLIPQIIEVYNQLSDTSSMVAIYANRRVNIGISPRTRAGREELTLSICEGIGFF